MILPPPIHPGDTLGIVDPSSPFERSLDPAVSYLKRRGYRVKLGKALFDRNRYLAGSDEARAADVNAMFADPDVTAIFVPRGGYGAARILDRIDYDAVERQPKALVGFSDTTALQLGLWAKTKLVSWSGVILAHDVDDVESPTMRTQTESSLWDALEGHQHLPVDGLQFLNEAGRASGPFLGGCLSLVASLAGTPWMPDFRKALLFLEDVHDPPYRIDRMLNQLVQAGVFRGAAGVVFGRFEGCEGDSDAEGTVLDVLNDLAERIDCPVAVGLPYGHVVGRRVLPVGIRATLSDDGILTFQSLPEKA